MKKACFLFLLGALLGGSLHAQERLELKRVELDSLVHFLRREFQPDIYYIKDQAEQSTFSVSAPRQQFMPNELFNTVTVRYRDSMEQERVALDDLVFFIQKAIKNYKPVQR